MPAPAPVDEEEKGPDPRDVDKVLGELVALGGRWALFRRFVADRLTVSLASRDRLRLIWLLVCLNSADVQDEPDDDIETPVKEPATEKEVVVADQDQADKEAKSDDMDIIVQSGSQRAIENLLRVYYEPLELWFLRMSIEKVCRGVCYPFHCDLIPVSTPIGAAYW